MQQIQRVSVRIGIAEEEVMSDAQETKSQGRSWHLWLVGIVGFLWSAIGVLSFMLVQMNVEAHHYLCRVPGSLTLVR